MNGSSVVATVGECFRSSIVNEDRVEDKGAGRDLDARRNDVSAQRNRAKFTPSVGTFEEEVLQQILRAGWHLLTEERDLLEADNGLSQRYDGEHAISVRPILGDGPTVVEREVGADLELEDGRRDRTAGDAPEIDPSSKTVNYLKENLMRWVILYFRGDSTKSHDQ